MSRLQQGNHKQAVQPASEGSRANAKKVFPILPLLVVVLFTLLFAGVAVPSFLRSELPNNRNFSSGFLHTFTIAHTTLTYTFGNLVSAILGASFGAAAVLFKGSLRQMLCRWPIARKSGRASYIGGRLTA